MAGVSDLELQSRYGGEFVALRGNEVVAHAMGYEKLEDQLDTKGLGRTELKVRFVPSRDIIYVPSVYSISTNSDRDL